MTAQTKSETHSYFQNVH